MKIDRVNLDFDFALAHGNLKIQNSKFLKEFEYIYLLTNDKDRILSNEVEYSKEYIDHLMSHGFKMPEFTKKGASDNWWGDLLDFEKAIRLNSKIKTSIWCLEKSLAPDSLKIITDEEELMQSMKCDQKYYYRSEYGFSGTSNKIITSKKYKGLRYPGTICPLLEQVVNFGVTVDLKTREYFICLNEVESGRFTGGRIISLEQLNSLSSVEIKDKDLETIFIELQKIAGDVVIEFDSLIYVQNNIEKWYQVVEINYRKTMGYIIYKLNKILGPGKWIFDSSFKKESFEAQLKLVEEKYGSRAILTSPVTSKIATVYLID